MAETKTEPAPAAAAEGGSGENHQQQKTVVVVGVDDSDHSYHALEWTVRHVAAGMAGAADLVIVHAKPSPSSVVSFGGPGAGEAMRYVEADLRKMAEAVVDRARRVCIANSVHALIEVVEGEPRYVLCNAAEKHHADLLVVGSHGYGAIKRAFLGSVSDYCAHHTRCSVMIVKSPRPKC
ncbi:universal stress protein A-like protein [Panicum miliaceum]|uniref:Universal stress protein A-like protein n=1 Tax=Panicum miliaceum TaxID=4540 RepID=A0A3L6QPP4_PANMI|nr:universal stress protein A-like protein [Panicum miliaceum]